MKIKDSVIYIIIFLLLLILLYIIPKIMINLFNSIIGFIIIFSIIYLISRKNNSFAFGLFMIFIIFYFSISKTNSLPVASIASLPVASLPVASLPVASLKEGYTSSTWSNELIEKFLAYQYFHNPKYIFDIDILQKQVSSKEAEEYLTIGKWVWSPKVENMYKNYIIQSQYVSINTNASLENAQQIYNEKAITKLMAWNSKEGQFILNGAVIGHSKNLPKNINNQIKCNENGQMIKIINKNMDIYPGYMIQEKTVLPSEDIPKTLAGFRFIDNPCNPCLQKIQDSNNKNCKFKLNVGDGGEISSIWKYLWGSDKEEKIKGNADNIGVQMLKTDNDANTRINMNF